MVSQMGGQMRRRGPKTGRHLPETRRTQLIDKTTLRASEATSQNAKIEATRMAHRIDESMGFERFEAGKKRVGWLCNMHSTTCEDDSIPGGRAAVDFYFLEDSGDYFKATIQYDPYFLIAVRRGREAEVEEWCRRAFDNIIKTVKSVEKEDLQMPNHLLGTKRTLLKLSFENVNDLLAVRKIILPIAEKNKKQLKPMEIYMDSLRSTTNQFDIYDGDQEMERQPNNIAEASDSIIDIREYDVPYHVRVAIDKDIRIGKWYNVEARSGTITLSCIEDRLQRADPVVFAFDIETTKLPLKFPDAAIDQIMMISYMVDGQGFLLVNREIVSEDIDDFEYSPKPEFEGPFRIFNEPDERSVLTRFFAHIKACRPTVMVTYNGDFFDWPFIEARASILGYDLYQEVGFKKNAEDIYQSDYCAHMDAFAWVNRDSYLPQGSRGLKAVTVAKLGYDPDELDPELMTPYARERPQILAEYSVSDAVATYYLYMKYVHPFIFSLCTIIPLGPDDVLRKGTGTLCEMLLMVQAYQKDILLPNKHQAPREAFWEGHLLESQTYVGGHVESIEAGVFRSDIPYDFALDPSAVDGLIRDIDAALKFSITVEEHTALEEVLNYEEVREQIAGKLRQLKEEPRRTETPSIYHLDVTSMYPNIMTTNRLQPDSMIQESDCAACDFNRPGKTCDRRMPWSWRGEFLPAKRDEYNMIRHALENERFNTPGMNGLTKSFQDMSLDEQAALLKKRLQDYCRKVYHKIHDARTIEKEAVICQRENPFYVDTVKKFRDRRYDFKGSQKVWKGKVDTLKAAGAPYGDVEEAKKMVILFDSLQLAHKVILNSFYGYVMRKGSRWYSMEMAGVTCLTGAKIIQMARQLVEKIGRPLELDTDGIWCILPATFPESVKFSLKNGKSMSLSYPCVMLNHLVHVQFTNHQYQDLVNPTTHRYETHSENSIFFEVDGPYRAMILPTSKEEDKNLKKRYAVFNHDGTLAELKGFEVKRRGELKLIKIFQTQIFKFFLEGATLEETYSSVAKVANQWLDVLDQHGTTLADEELIELICENKNMAKTLAEYGAQKSTAITTAKRLAEFLGEQMVKDKGLNCKYIISSKPRNAPVTERAVPVAIFSAQENVKRYFLRKWLRDDPGDMDPRSVLDWNYYRERLASVIQKLITIPAALQKVKNPVPRVPHPGWLDHRIRTKNDIYKQKKMTQMFDKVLKDADVNILNRIPDMEDFRSSSTMKMAKATLTQKVEKRKAPMPSSLVKSNPFSALPSKVPSISHDYQRWLEYQKKKWKIQKQVRKRRRQLFGEKQQDFGDGIRGAFQSHAELLFVNKWQILQLKESGVPGEVKAFVLIGRKVHVLKIIVRRQLYLKSSRSCAPDVDIELSTIEEVPNVLLPDGQVCEKMYRLCMPEPTYLRSQSRLKCLLDRSDIEGLYETNVSPATRAIIELSNVCAFDEGTKGALGKGLEEGFDHTSLRPTLSDQTYLTDVLLSYVYLYHVVAGEREVFALFSIATGKVEVVLLNKNKDIQGLPSLERLYREELHRHQEDESEDHDASGVERPSEIVVKSKQTTTKRKARIEVQDALRRLRSEELNPVILLTESNRHQTLFQDVPTLNDSPNLILKFTAESSQILLPGWQSALAKQLVSRFFQIGVTLSHTIRLSRYTSVPFCNVVEEDPQYLIDISYARRLTKERAVLWWTGGPQPDNAGFEKDGARFVLDAVKPLTVNNAGTFSSVCIDIDVKNLATNAIVASCIADEISGTDSANMNSVIPYESGSAAGEAGVDGGSANSASAFTIMRSMIKAWWGDACRGDQMADYMVHHLCRWIRSSRSYLYNPVLHHYAENICKRALQQLLGDFRKLGSQIVFANSDRLILQTTKSEIANAFAYCQYVIKTVKMNPLLVFLDLEVQEYWDYLAWYDEYNYAGKGCQSVTADDGQNLEMVMHWQFTTFLPSALQPIFRDWVAEFIDIMYSHTHPQLTASAASSTPRPTQLPFVPVGTDMTRTQLLQQSFADPLQKQVAYLLRQQRTEHAQGEQTAFNAVPVLPGSNSEVTNPVLLLVKCIMQVISLERNITLEARALRRDLLQQFDIREFSADATFGNPSSSLLVRQFDCEECSAAHDIDLCRHGELLIASDDNFGQPVPRPVWPCRTCGSALNMALIEEILISEVQSMATAWSTQDLICSKCKRTRTNEFMEHCPCAGEWVCTIKREEITSQLSINTRAADFFGFEMLSDVIDGMGIGL